MPVNSGSFVPRVAGRLATEKAPLYGVKIRPMSISTSLASTLPS